MKNIDRFYRNKFRRKFTLKYVTLKNWLTFSSRKKVSRYVDSSLTVYFWFCKYCSNIWENVFTFVFTAYIIEYIIYFLRNIVYKKMFEFVNTTFLDEKGKSLASQMNEWNSTKNLHLSRNGTPTNCKPRPYRISEQELGTTEADIANVVMIDRHFTWLNFTRVYCQYVLSSRVVLVLVNCNEWLPVWQSVSQSLCHSPMCGSSKLMGLLLLLVEVKWWVRCDYKDKHTHAIPK